MDIRKHENGWIYEINSPRWARGFVMTLKDAANRLLHYGGDASEIGVLVSLHNSLYSPNCISAPADMQRAISHERKAMKSLRVNVFLPSGMGGGGAVDLVKIAALSVWLNEFDMHALHIKIFASP